MANTYVAIATVTVGSGGASSIDFSSIPGTYTDLLLKISTRSTGTESGNTWDGMLISFNGSSTSFTARALYGQPATGNAASATFTRSGAIANGNTTTASTFSNCEIYIPNYAGSKNKSYSADAVSENNASQTLPLLYAGLWSNTAAITSIGFTLNVNNFVQYSTATLYGIKNS